MQIWKWRNLKRPIVDQCRTAPRLDAADIPNIKIINEADKPEIKLINISRRGALIEVHERMSPGSSICLQLVMDENVHFIKGRIIGHRSFSMNSGVFKIAIAFDEDFGNLPSSDDLLEDEDFLK